MMDRIEVNIDGGLDGPLPRMVPARQTFDPSKLEDITAAVTAQLERPEVAARIKPGQTIAVGAGSRGVANIAETVTALVAGLKARGAKPFVFPAMGSHGGATVEGQTRVLRVYGITEESVGAPIRATMETAQIGHAPDGTPVHVDRYAHEADGIILVNRIKPHTSFRGAIESGIVKMMTIGMGKIAGATAFHFQGMNEFGTVLPPAAAYMMERLPILFGLGLVENAFDETCLIEALLPEGLIEREIELQAEAKRRMGRILFDDFDVLVVEEMGKEISGAGFDPNITGRNSRGITGFTSPRVQKIVVLDLTEATHGNATGIGLADVITMKLFNKINFPETYANVITSAFLDGGAIPIIMNTPREAIQLAVKTLIRVPPEQARIVCIRNTLTLRDILISEPMVEEARAHPQLEITGAAAPLRFDDAGNLRAA